MTTVDSLDIKISAQANSASASLDKLAAKLNTLSGAINKINVGNISKEFAKLSNLDVFSNFTKSAKVAESAMGKIAKEAEKGLKVKTAFDVSDYQKVSKELSAKFSDAGMDIKFTGNLTSLEKQYQKLSTLFDKLAEKEQKIISVGAVSPESSVFKNLQYDISATLNKMDTLSKKMESLKIPQTEIRINGLTEAESATERLKSGIEEVSREATVSFQSLNYNSEAMRTVFGEGAEKIQNWSQAINQFGINASEELNSFAVKSNLATSKMQEFGNTLKSLVIPPINETNLTKLQSSLSKTEAKLEELRTKLENGITMGKISENIDDSGFVRLQEQIKLTELRAEALKDKIREVESASAKASKFSGLATNTKKISSAFSGLKNALKGVDNLIIRAARALLNFGNVERKTTGSIRRMESGFKRLWRSILPFVGIYEIFNFGRNAVETASSLTEVQNVVDVTFGKYADLVDKMAETSITDFGMSELTVKKISSRFQAMGTAMGFAQGKMADMSINLTKLAADMASFYNVEQKDVAEDLESIFTGQTRPLRQYGLDLTQATLQEWAMKNGLDANIQSMSQAEKTMLRYQYVLANTGAAQGDFARTADTWANQTRILRQNFEQLGAVIGNIIINVLKPLVKALNVAMGYIISFAKTVSNALGKIFGWTYEESGGGFTLSDDFADAAGSAEDMAGATGDAADSAKKLRHQLQGFDALNNLTSNLDSASSGMGNLGLGGAGLGDVGGDWKPGESILKEFESEIDNLYKLGKYIGDSLKKALDSINWNAIRKKARKIGKGLAELINGFVEAEDLGYTIGRTLAEALNTAFEFLNGFVHELHWKSIGKFIADQLNGFFENIDWELIRDTFVTGFKGLADSINSFTDNFHWDNISNTISNSINVIAETVYTFFSTIDFGKLGENLGEQLRETVEKIDWYMVGRALGSIVQSALDFLISFIEELDMSAIANAIRDTLKGFLEEVDMSDLAGVILTLLAAKLTLAAGTFAFESAAKSILSGLKDAFASSTATETATTIGTSIGGSIMSGIKSALGDLAVLVAGFAVGSEIDDLLVDSGALNFMDKTGEKTEIYLEHYTGWSGKVQLLKDEFEALGNAMQGLPAVIGLPEQGFFALEKAMEAVRKGTIYTDEQMEKMRETWQLSEEDIEMLRQETLDANPILREMADTFGLYDATPETLEDIAYGMSNLANYGEILPSTLSNMTEEAQAFFGQQTIDGMDYYIGKLQGVETEANNVATSLNGVSQSIEEGISKGIGETDTWNIWTGFFGNMKTSVNSEAQSTGKEIGENLNLGLSSGISENASSMASVAELAMGGVIAAVKAKAGIHSPSTVFAGIGANLMLGLQNGINQNVSNILTRISNFVTQLKAPFSNIKSSFLTIGKNIMSGLLSGISSMSESIFTKVKSIASSVATTVKSALNIHSPSRVMFELGDYTMQGFQLGIESLYRPIIQSVSAFGKDLQIAPAPSLESMYGGYQESFSAPNFNSNSYIQNSYSSDNAETNALLREQNALLREILEKPTIDGNTIFSEVRSAYQSRAKRLGSSTVDPVMA